MNKSLCCKHFIPILHSRAQATANITGSRSYPDISGIVRFYQTKEGVIVYAEISGLPEADNPCGGGVFGFHIHEGSTCTGNADDPFADVKGHYNPNKCPHPFHAGDLPPLFGNGGTAFSVFLTNRFSVSEIIGRSIIIHAHADDFMTQPSGNSGTKIACGVIRRARAEGVNC